MSARCKFSLPGPGKHVGGISSFALAPDAAGYRLTGPAGQVHAFSGTGHFTRPPTLAARTHAVGTAAG